MAENFARRGTKKDLAPDEAKRQVLAHIEAGLKVEEACSLVERSAETYRKWRREDADFRLAVDQIRQASADTKSGGGVKAEVPDFETFCRDYLHQPLHIHQLRMYDVIEGRPPRQMHESMSYDPGYPNRVLINVPPEHCPTVDTLIPTTDGLRPAGEIRVGDFVFDADGKPVEVLESETVTDPETDQYRVTFSTGDTFDVDASHMWFARDLRDGAVAYNRPPVEYRTDQMAAHMRTPGGKLRWRVDVAPAVHHEEKSLPLDPYLFGYWLGDGDTEDARFAVGTEDLDNLVARIQGAGFAATVRPQKGGFEVRAKGMRKLLPLGIKRISTAYLTASIPQRMELLRGLMDSDGTITVKDARARFVQDEARRGLVRDVYQLVSSLGYQAWTKQYGRMCELGFRPGAEPVFGLERKASRQRPLTAGTKALRRTISSIEKLDECKPLQQISVMGGAFLMGEGYVLTHNAKSTTFTVNYSIWLIHKNPDVRIIIMSQGKGLAEKMLYEIKLKLTSPLYREMHLRFAPEGVDGKRGWKDPDNSWTNSLIYVKGKGTVVEAVGKDPTVQALGLGGQIYGSRADVIFLDDTITTKNAREIDRQETLLDREIESRLPSEQEGGGLLAILGTRVAPQDLYRHLREAEDGDERRIWTFFRQPAVLDYGDGDSATWTTLWPEKWDGPSLSKKRRNASWNLVYQQLDVDDEMTFKADAVNASVNGARFPGPLTRDGHLHRPAGMDGLYRVGGLDPATVGKTAMIVSGLEPETAKRWVVDGWNKGNATAQQIIDQFKFFTETYQLHEWVIERNAFQRFITELPELVDFCRQRGCRITPHNSTANKFDEDWGIQTMAPLFDSCVIRDADRPGGWKRSPRDQHLIELPSLRQNDWVNDLVQQLTIWQPSGMAQKAKTDLVMALWFTHIAHQKIVNRKRLKKSHRDSAFTTPAALKRQGVIDLVALRREKQELRDRREGIA